MVGATNNIPPTANKRFKNPTAKCQEIVTRKNRYGTIYLMLSKRWLKILSINQDILAQTN